MLVVTGPVDYTVVNTLDDIQNKDALVSWVDHDDPVFVNATTTITSNYINTPVAARVDINSATAGTTVLRFNVVQSDVAS